MWNSKLIDGQMLQENKNPQITTTDWIYVYIRRKEMLNRKVIRKFRLDHLLSKSSDFRMSYYCLQQTADFAMGGSFVCVCVQNMYICI